MERVKKEPKDHPINSKSLIRDIGGRETPKKLEARRRKIWIAAASRIEEILSSEQDSDIDDTERTTLRSTIQKVLKTYNFSTGEVKKMSLIDARQIAMRLIASDLLVSEFYNGDGTLSDFSEKYYPGVNAEDYTVIPGTWEYARGHLEKRLQNSGWRETDNDDDDYLGAGLILDQGNDTAAEYAKWFGQKSIISIPFEIVINNYGVSINYQDDFVEPYGGDNYTPRLIFLPREGPSTA